MCFSIKCCDFSELCQFYWSPGVWPATVYKHWHRGETERGRIWEYIKILEKTQYLTNTLYLSFLVNQNTIHMLKRDSWQVYQHTIHLWFWIDPDYNKYINTPSTCFKFSDSNYNNTLTHHSFGLLLNTTSKSTHNSLVELEFWL